jgi:DNA-damage-inducible protein D
MIGLGNDAIKQRKGIAKKENLMDRMDTTELAANRFRMTQRRDKLARERVDGLPQTIRAHEEVGREVREAIRRIGGTMPPPLLELEEKDATDANGRRRFAPPRSSVAYATG